jgi:hypothetical protein
MKTLLPRTATLFALALFGSVLSMLSPTAHAGIMQGQNAMMNGHYGCDCTSPTQACGCVT